MRRPLSDGISLHGVTAALQLSEHPFSVALPLWMVGAPLAGCFRQLIGLAENREGRLLLIKQLRRRRSGLFLAEKKDQNG